VKGCDTVKIIPEYRLLPLERALDTVIPLQNMPLSHSNCCHEPSMSEIECKEPWEGLSNEMVDLSVSVPLSAGKQRAFPLSRDRLLTIEWK
jgi:hypothetical protein